MGWLIGSTLLYLFMITTGGMMTIRSMLRKSPTDATKWAMIFLFGLMGLLTLTSYGLFVRSGEGFRLMRAL